MFGGPGGVCLTTNLAAIFYVRKSTLYLSICKNTLSQSKQFCYLKVCHGTYQSLEESLLFFMDKADLLLVGSSGCHSTWGPQRWS